MGEQYVGIDLHRRRSVIVRMTPAGEVLETVRVDNDPVALSLELAKAGPDPEVVLEATYGWYWAADLLQAGGARVHLAHPLGVKMFGYQRVKTDARDSRNLAELLRMGRLPEAWLAPPQVRELRELVRYRAKLVALRSGLKAQVHAVLAKEGVRVPMSDLFGVAGARLLDRLQLGRAYGVRVASLRSLIGAYDQEITTLQREVADALAGDVGYLALQAIPGVVRCWRRCSWPRSATSAAAPAHRSCAPGPGSRLVTASPTPPCAAARSPNRVPGWSPGPPSRPPSGCPRQASRPPTSTASPTGAAPASAGSRPPASC
jgi:Transposase